MNVVERNLLYLKGVRQEEGLFPHLEVAPASGFFNWDFGLAELPREPGIIVIRGPRQYGKSTWLEYQLRETLRQFGPGTALFLNGDYIAGPDEGDKIFRTQRLQAETPLMIMVSAMYPDSRH